MHVPSRPSVLSGGYCRPRDTDRQVRPAMRLTRSQSKATNRTISSKTDHRLTSWPFSAQRNFAEVEASEFSTPLSSAQTLFLHIDSEAPIILCH